MRLSFFVCLRVKENGHCLLRDSDRDQEKQPHLIVSLRTTQLPYRRRNPSTAITAPSSRTADDGSGMGCHWT